MYAYISIFTLTLAAMVPGQIFNLWGSSGCIPEYPSGLSGASSSLILSTDSLLCCRVLINDGSQELNLAQSCGSRSNKKEGKDETSNCASLSNSRAGSETWELQIWLMNQLDTHIDHTWLGVCC